MISYTVRIMKQHGTLPRPTEGELELLRILWERGPSTVRDVHQEISAKRAVGYTSVLKLLQIMTEKGLVEREESGKAHVYRPAATQNETQDQLLRDISARLFAGSAAQLAMHALALEPVNDQELDALRRLIEQKRQRL
jgi:BlaI family transcriptional regulator, penicillinase repressor